MKTAGDYALLHANGMSWKDLIELIRAEALCAAAELRAKALGEEDDA